MSQAHGLSILAQTPVWLWPLVGVLLLAALLLVILGYRAKLHRLTCEHAQLRLILQQMPDITQPTAAEQSLAASEASSRALLTAIPDVMFRLTADGSILEFIDQLTMPGDGQGGRNIRELFSPDASRLLLDGAARALSSRNVQVLEYSNGKGPGRKFFEARIVCSGESEVLVILRNITERKRAEDDLRAREAQLRALVSALPDLIFRVTRDFRIAGCIAPDHDELYMPPDQFLGRQISQIMPPSVAHELELAIRRVYKTNQNQIVKYTLPVNGQEQRYEARLIHGGEDNHHQVLALVRNITDIRNNPESADVTTEGNPASHG